MVTNFMQIPPSSEKNDFNGQLYQQKRAKEHLFQFYEIHFVKFSVNRGTKRFVLSNDVRKVLAEF